MTAEDHRGRVIGYAMVAVADGPDDTFQVKGGVAEVVTLIVASDKRSSGLGRALLAAAEAIACDHGYDTVKIALMSGNVRAQSFYIRQSDIRSLSTCSSVALTAEGRPHLRHPRNYDRITGGAARGVHDV